ncbi:MAG: hypothetical protein WDW38_004020 [Sanguina aurantia]
MAAMVHTKDSQGSPVPLSKPATPGAAKSHLATASRNLSPQLGQLPFSSSARSTPSNHSPSTAAVTSPTSKISPMQRLCNQAIAVMELARGPRHPAAAGGGPSPALAAVDQVDESRGRDAAFGSELKPSRATVEEYQPDDFIGAEQFLGDWPGFEYIEGGEQGTGYYNLGRAKALTSLTAASAAKAARNAITPAPAPMPAQPASTLSVQSLGQQRSASESHLLPPPQPATVATTLPPAPPTPPERPPPHPFPSVLAALQAVAAPAVAGLTAAAVAALGGSLSHLHFPASALPAATAAPNTMSAGSTVLPASAAAATAISVEAANWQPFAESTPSLVPPPPPPAARDLSVGHGPHPHHPHPYVHYPPVPGQAAAPHPHLAHIHHPLSGPQNQQLLSNPGQAQNQDSNSIMTNSAITNSSSQQFQQPGQQQDQQSQYYNTPQEQSQDFSSLQQWQWEQTQQVHSQHSPHNQQHTNPASLQQQQQQQQQRSVNAHILASPQTWAQRGGPPLLAMQHISQLPLEVQYTLHQRQSELRRLQHDMQVQRAQRFRLTSDLATARRHISALEAQLAQAGPPPQPAGRAATASTGGPRSMSLDFGPRSTPVGGSDGRYGASHECSAGATVPALQARVLNLESQLTATLAKFAALAQQSESRGSEASRSSEEAVRQQEMAQEIQQGTELQAQSLMQALRESRSATAAAAAQSDGKDQVIELLLQQLSMMTDQLAEAEAEAAQGGPGLGETGQMGGMGGMGEYAFGEEDPDEAGYHEQDGRGGELSYGRRSDGTGADGGHDTNDRGDGGQWE